MRVALINPAFNRYGGIKGHGGSMMPLNLCYLAAYIRNRNVQVRIFDAEVNGWSHEATVGIVRHYNPHLIGMTTNTCVFDSVIALSKLLKIALPNIPIVAGGSHVSALPRQSLHETDLDSVVVGEGEIAFKIIVRRIQEHQELKDIYLGEYIKNLDDLPFPARDLLDNEKYSPPPTKRVSSGPNTLISTSRGCPYNCGFCGAHTVWGKTTRMRSALSVVSELEHCINAYGIRSFNFTDELFTVNRLRVVSICNSIISKNLDISWVCSARAQGLDDEILKLMYKAGCREIGFGIESGNKQVLENIDKSLDLDKARAVLKRTKRARITTHASYMFGYLGETKKSMKDTFRYAKKVNTDIAAFFIASPLPGTRFYREAQEFIRPDATWIDYSPLSKSKPVVELPNLNSEVIRKFHKKALKWYYLRPRYIIARVLRLRHWYEIVNIWEGIKILLRLT